MPRPLCMAARSVLHAWGAVGRAPGWRYQIIERWGGVLAEGTLLERCLPDGSIVACDLTDYVQRFVYFDGLYEPVEAWVFSRMLRPGMIVVDGGANIGQYTLLAAGRVGAGGRVWAFEPVAANFARLTANVQVNGLANVRLTQAGLWNTRTSLELALPGGMDDNAGSFAVGVAGAARYERASALPFDEFAAAEGIDRVDAVKLDIEGSEAFALEGMRRTLERDRPVLMVEMNRDATQRAGASLEAVWDLLVEALGYRAWLIGDDASHCRPLTGVHTIGQRNVLFHHADLPREVTAGWSLKSVLRWARSGRPRRTG